MKVSTPAALVDAVLAGVPFSDLYPDYGRSAVNAARSAASSRLASAIAATLSPGDFVHFGPADRSRCLWLFFDMFFDVLDPPVAASLRSGEIPPCSAPVPVSSTPSTGTGGKVVH